MACLVPNQIKLNTAVDNLLCLQDVKLLLEDIGELKPSIFCAVPRVLDRVYSGNLPHN